MGYSGARAFVDVVAGSPQAGAADWQRLFDDRVVYGAGPVLGGPQPGGGGWHLLIDDGAVNYGAGSAGRQHAGTACSWNTGMDDASLTYEVEHELPKKFFISPADMNADMAFVPNASMHVLAFGDEHSGAFRRMYEAKHVDVLQPDPSLLKAAVAKVASPTLIAQLMDLVLRPEDWDGDGIEQTPAAVAFRALQLVQQTSPIAGEPDAIPARAGSIQLLWYFGPEHYVTYYVDADAVHRAATIARDGVFTTADITSVGDLQQLLADESER